MENDFKSASELGITEVERIALIEVMERMEHGELVSEHGLPSECAVRFKDTPKIYMPRFFTHTEECGTVGCLAGWAHILSDGEAFPELSKNKELAESSIYPNHCPTNLGSRLPSELRRLFLIAGHYATHDSRDLSTATLIKRMRNYLTTGNVDGTGIQTRR